VFKKLLAAALLVAALPFAWFFLRPLPKPRPGDAARGADEFLHSDLGSEWYGSMPRAVYQALPQLLPDLLVEGWEGAAGLLPDPANPKGPPVGLVEAQVLGSTWYASNCALCHAGRFNGALVPGAPNFDLDVQKLVYVVEQAIRRGLTLADVERVSAPLTLREKIGVSFFLTVARWKVARKKDGWFKAETGAGRSDALNGWKRALGIDDSAHKTIVDIPGVFGQRLKFKTLYDGAITGDEAARVMLTELQKGRPARGPLIDRQVFDDLVAYMKGPLQPPPYPFALDASLVARGHEVFSATCRKCHGTYAPDEPSYPNLRIPAATVGTDPERALAMGPEMTQALQRYDFRDFLKIDPAAVYMPPPLNGVYLTAPYLHNGSVPTLWHLLHPDARPAAFWRRFNAFDPVRVGLVCESAPENECAKDPSQRAHDPRVLYKLDTRKPGNSNAGHLYGSALPDPDKLALLEYLKTI
jgi:mono/diheme cytochrome c family protein